MGTDNIGILVENLERQELEGASAGGTVPQQVYTQLLAIYLYQHDLCNAKYLWKRIPASVKTNNTELQNIWKVGQKMWKRDFAGIYVALSEQWSTDVAEIMDHLKEKVRQRAAHLVGTAYSSLSLSALASFTGLTLQEAAQKAVESGWTIEGDGDNRTVKPTRPPQVNIHIVSCEDQLSKLTDFVSFLEN